MLTYMMLKKRLKEISQYLQKHTVEETYKEYKSLFKYFYYESKDK